MFRTWMSRVAGLILLAVPATSFAQPAHDADAQSLLSAFVSYTDLRLRDVQHTLELLAATQEVRSGEWESMEGLVSGYQKNDGALVAWFLRPDGSYYTGDKGLMSASLRDREYFPELMAGKRIIGALVVSRSTGERSAVVAVPLERDGKVYGAVGVSLFLDRLAAQLDSSLALAPDKTFFAVAPDARTTLHRRAERHFLDPREQGSESLKKATEQMMANPSGETTYIYDGVTKRALYRRSDVTRWTFVLGTNLPGPGGVQSAGRPPGSK